MSVPSNRQQWLKQGGIGHPPVSYPIPIEKGGTGATDAATARSALGLGAAALLDSPIPITDGGTGATDVASARNNLGLGAAALLGSPIPVANGGTGATDAASARGALHAQQAVEEVGVLELGASRTSEGYAYLDLHSKIGTDYDGRILTDADRSMILSSANVLALNAGGSINLAPGSGQSVSINGSVINALATKKVLMGSASSSGGMPNAAGSAWRWTDPQTVNFSSAFSSAPIIIANVSSTTGVSACHVRSKNASSFTWMAFEYGTADAGRNVTIDWIAIGD